ncbi:MAG: AI-2E family transporter [Nitrospirota bacterium]
MGTRNSKLLNILITAAAFVVIIAGMRAAESLIIQFLISAFIAIICAPPLFWMQKKGVPTVVAILLIVLGIIVIGSIMTTVIGTSLNDFSRDLPSYQQRLQGKTAELLEWLQEKGIDIYKEGLLEAINPGEAMSLVAGLLTKFGKLLTNAFLILITVIFILFEASGLPIKLRAALRNPDSSLGGFDVFFNNINRYMALKTLTSVTTGVAVGVLVTFLGVDYPLLWGLLAFMLNYVPSIGSIIAAIPAVLLALIQLGPGSAGFVALGYLIINLSIGGVIEPKVMGQGLGLSTLVVFLSLVFWGWVLGPIGMLLSVPLTMTVKIALDSNEDTRWMAIILGSEVSAEKALNEMSTTKEADQTDAGLSS